MTVIHPIAPHAQGKIEEDNIFVVGAKAKAAKERFGKEHVLDGSIGILLDDQGQLALMPSVEKATKALPPSSYAPYAPISGLPEFCEDVCTYVFGPDALVRPQFPLGAVATAGATGAVRLVIWNFLEQGESFLTHDFYWSPYRAIARDSHRPMALFPSFDTSNQFNLSGCLEHLESLLKQQDRVLLILNVPCHNPSGMCLSLPQTQALKSGLDDLAQRYPQKAITVLIDGAYWEFGGMIENAAFLGCFEDLPENMTFLVAYSISKSLTRYGFRTGALLVRSASETIKEEILGTMTASIRSTWSNTTRLGQAVFSKLYRDPQLRQELQIEQTHFATLCNQRGSVFMNEALAIGLPATPYEKGFFVTLPTQHAKAIANTLMEERIFLVPMAGGVRVAFCALPSHQIPGLAQRIASHFR
jgi:aromatic-amino-acid transaminase